MSGKIHPTKPVGGTQFGTTIQKSDPAGLHGKSKGGGKTGSNGVVPHAVGPTYDVNKSHISMPNANKGPDMTKVLKTTQGRESLKNHDTVCDRTASQSGPGGPTTPAYPLKTSYGK